VVRAQPKKTPGHVFVDALGRDSKKERVSSEREGREVSLAKKREIPTWSFGKGEIKNEAQTIVEP